jgi:hypothetical protein
MYLYRSLLLLSLAALSLQCTTSHAEDFDSDDSANSFVFDDIDIPDINTSRACTFADEIVPPLNECGVIAIFEENIFNKTSNLNKRSWLDYTFYQLPFPSNNNLDVKASVFWNMTGRCFFTGGSSCLSSYLGLQNDSLINKIQQVQNNVNNSVACNDFFVKFLQINPAVFNIDVRKILGLFAGATVQQRLFGLFAEVTKNFERWNIGVKVPLLYQERNIFLSDSEIDAIDMAVNLPPANPDQINQFAKSHLISDRAGLGDSRLFISYQASDREKLDLQLGLYTTMPTALPMQKGIIGSEFPKQCLTPPEFDLCGILSLGLSAAALERRLKHELSIISEDFLDSMAANLLEDNLGNGKHWGFAFFAEPTLALNDYWSWHNRASFEYLFPANESRFFIQDANLAQFASFDFNSQDEDVAEVNLRFLNSRLLSMFFPNSFNVLVRPGPIAMFTTDITYQGKQWWATFGNDVWFQGKEHIDFTVDQNGFDTQKCIKPFAFQYKMFGGISCALYRERSSWVLSLKADGTVASSGIGKDYSIVLSATTTY